MKRTMLVTGALAAAVALTLAGCSTGSTGSTGGQTASGKTDQYVATAKAAVKAAEVPAKFAGPSSTPTPPANKTIAVIEWGAAATAVVAAGNGVKAADDLLGWKTETFDGNFLPATENSDVLQAVSQGVSGIVLVAVNPAGILSGMEAAHKAGIPVVDYADDPTVGTTGAGVYGVVSGENTEGGKVLADYIIADSKGTAKVAVYHTPDFNSTLNRYKGFMAEIKKCSGCSVLADQSYSSGSATQQIGLQVTSTLSANPKTTYLFFDIGQFAEAAAKSVTQANLKARVVGFDCNPADLQNIRAGSPQVACWASDAYTAGWAAADQLIRGITGASASDKLQAPVRLFDTANLPAKDEWHGDFDPKTEYGRLWGKS